MEGRTPVVQLDETFRTNVHGVEMFHVITTTNTNQTFTLAYCFMRTAKKEYLTWILQAILDFGFFLEPEAMVTDADKGIGSDVSTVFPNVPPSSLLLAYSGKCSKTP